MLRLILSGRGLIYVIQSIGTNVTMPTHHELPRADTSFGYVSTPPTEPLLKSEVPLYATDVSVAPLGRELRLVTVIH